MWARLCLGFLLLPSFCAISASAQQAASTTVITSSESAIAVPSLTGVLGKIDPAALAELVSHLAVVGSTPWIGMQGTGKISFGPQETTYDATLSNLGNDMFRLDAQTSKGQTSIRSRSGVSKGQDGDGTTFEIPPDTAFEGIFPFEILRVANLTQRGISLLDQGTISIDSTALHRITLEKLSVGYNPATKTHQTVAIDFYFDPTTHLLVKSVTSGVLAQGQRAKFLIVVTYADYRRVGTVLIPFRYTETIEGQQSRSLQLTDVQLNPALDATYFAF